MNSETVRRFEEDFAPRIATRIAGLFGAGVEVVVLRSEGPGEPTRVRLTAQPIEALRRYPYALNVFLTWDGDEIERLMGSAGEARFAGYLSVLACKLDGWHQAREVDFRSCSQAEPVILIGGLDFAI